MDRITHAAVTRHLDLLASSYQQLTGRSLVGQVTVDIVDTLDHAPFALLSHGTEPDPVFNYANQPALALFEMCWEEFTTLPSRLSAEPVNQAERERLLEKVTTAGYVDDYCGVRISRSGRRFMIQDATVWNVHNHQGIYRGQAALIRRWQEITE